MLNAPGWSRRDHADCIVANCPGISGTVPDFLPVSRKGPENLL